MLDLCVGELECLKKMAENCDRCNKRHCFKKCTNHITPEIITAIIQQLILFKKEQKGIIEITADCEHAERSDGKCVGYQKSEIDDEPCEPCKYCKDFECYEEYAE